MSTTVHYKVADDNGMFLGEVFTPELESDGYGWLTYGDSFESRVEAERLAAEHGGTVHRITDEAVGLRWRVSFVDSSTFYLYDDNGKFRRQVGGVVSVLGEYVPFTGVGSSRCALEPLATLDEAKAAAEAAVRVAWT